MNPVETQLSEKVKCHHCGDVCLGESIFYLDKPFCCNGCKAVFELFQDSELIDIYTQSKNSKTEISDKYDYLNNEQIAEELLDFQSDDHNSLKISLPAIHCSSCIYLLENLNRLEAAIFSVKVNFSSKKAQVHYDPARISLKAVAELLDTIGYAPQFIKHEGKAGKKQVRSSLPIKIGVAAFCFGNIMLLSFPEYLGIEDSMDEEFKRFFSYLNIILALPVLLYSANDYFVSAFKGLRNKFVNIDVPIALGVITLFLRSAYEVLANVGSGYFDSLAGLIFFLLIGKWFQNKTYDNLSFERDYKSYFPLAVLRDNVGKHESVPISSLAEGDQIVIRNEEIIPADAVLLSENANIDYSFVTGEEALVKKKRNDYLYAGGRHVGQNIRLEVKKESSQSYLTELWNNQVFKESNELKSEILINKVSKYFTLVILVIAVTAASYWMLNDSGKGWQVFTAVLIVACPCALALSAPFTNGNALRIFGRNKLYLKSADIAERLSDVNTIVFDKTGTLTEHGNGEVKFYPDSLSAEEHAMIYKLVENSTHPISKKIMNSLDSGDVNISVENFQETAGAGIEANVNRQHIRLGSEKFIAGKIDEAVPGLVHVSINNNYRGYFKIKNQYRENIKHLVVKLGDQYKLSVLSGDNDQERGMLEDIFPKSTTMLFRQQPQDKLDYIKQLQAKGKKVMMLGDGLNDAGALKQSDIGIAVTEDVSSFSPACDGIIEGSQLKHLWNYLDYSKISKHIIIASFIISFLYNTVGLSFAIAGALTPIFAAILMPLSSISVVLFTTFTGSIIAKRKQLL